jgi:hypothetical protein
MHGRGTTLLLRLPVTEETKLQLSNLLASTGIPHYSALHLALFRYSALA